MTVKSMVYKMILCIISTAKETFNNVKIKLERVYHGLQLVFI